jgi:hypothetical protein
MELGLLQTPRFAAFAFSLTELSNLPFGHRSLQPSDKTVNEGSKVIEQLQKFLQHGQFLNTALLVLTNRTEQQLGDYR